MNTDKSYVGSSDLTAESRSPMFYITSLKHTTRDHEHNTFWGPNHRGYVLVVKDGHTGEYTAAEAMRLNDGFDCIAVSVDVVKTLRSPEPYYARRDGTAQRFYDTPGPVVNNTRANWNRLIAASLTEGRAYKPKPEVHRKARRSFALEGATA
jgi:hypothetical protein